ncbi:O-antigen ligase family protein [Qipengyuania flava]|uniref:O-antigen ligase family protein n=1 Tax=Qipengyuania flava TaxID=192812 RepID=UPI001C6338B0|nr:O-antigen ligase family protein [Qipengyuania flava]QYJ06694.1 O-antigen ligase family protein [Qipengyuania flava]
MTRKGAVFCAFLVVAMVLGGGGSPSALPEVLVQLGFAAAFVLWFAWATVDQAGMRAVPRALYALAGVAIALPLIQLLPMPPALWQALPGREAQAGALAAIGEGGSWRSLSIAPHATFASLLAILPVAGAMLAASQLERRDRTAVAVAIVLVSLAGAGLGVLQMAGGPEEFRLYEKAHRGWLVAFHANRNAAADGLLIASLAMAVWTLGRALRHGLSATGLGIFAIVQAVFLIALIMTGSRAGIALCLVVVAIQLAMFRSAGIGVGRRRSIAWLAGVFAILAASFAWLSSASRLSQVAERFDATSDFRTELWTDTLTAIGVFFPAGSGIGTFAEAFLPSERLEVLDDLFPNRAHNDYLEFFLEAGILAPAALLIGLFCLISLVRSAYRASGGVFSPQILFSLGVLLVIALHSIVDYPLRNMAIAVLTGTAVGLLGSVGRSRFEPEKTEESG